MKKKINKKIFTGKVVSNLMEKTIVVSVLKRVLHPLYKKYVNKIKKIKAHDEKNEANIGDVVRVIEAKPISKTKCWNLVEIIEKVK